MVIEVRNSGINKGTAALEWLERRAPDFILAAGDDRTDEDTFEVLPPDAWTVRVGEARSRARFFVITLSVFWNAKVSAVNSRKSTW